MKPWSSNFDKRFNRVQKFLMWFIGGVAALIVCIYIGGAVLAYKAVGVAGEQDWSGGIKPVIERLWCGSLVASAANAMLSGAERPLELKLGKGE